MSDAEEAESPADTELVVPDRGEADSPADADASEAGKKAKHEAGEDADESDGRTFSVYGIASAVLGIVSVAVIVFGYITWSRHHREVDDRAYQNQVLRTAAGWAGALVNLNAANVDAGMSRLRGKTAGQLNADFDTTMQPYRAVFQKIKSRNTGRVESVSIEAVHNDLPADAEPAPPPLQPPPPGASRTDTVMVVATSMVEVANGKSEAVRWNFQLGVSDVGGAPLISGFRPLR